MKGKYQKPEIHIEYFALSQNIAQSCGYKDENYYGHPNHATKETCGWDDGFGEVYWVSTLSKCSGEYSPDLDTGEVCYNAPNGQPQIFAS